MEGHGLRVVEVLDAHEGLDEEGLRVFKIEVEEAHHGDAGVGGAELRRNGSVSIERGTAVKWKGRET